MFHLLLNIISYCSFLLLIMPATRAGVASTAAVLAIGICLIIYKKGYRVVFRTNKQYFLALFTILIAAALGVSFYNQWLPESQMQSIAMLLHMSIEMLLLIGSLVLSGLSVYFLYAALQAIVKTLSDANPQNGFKKVSSSAFLLLWSQ